MKKHIRRRSNIFIYTQITASLPFIEVNLPLTPPQMSMFINGLKYVIPCQSQFSRKPIHETMAEHYQKLSATVKDCLKNNKIVVTDLRAKQTFDELQQIFYGCHLNKLPKTLQHRTHREYKTVQSIRRLLRQRPDIVIRRTDKSKVFYIGKASDLERKAQEYMFKTEAYQEIASGRCPLADSSCAVQTLLDSLVAKQTLTKKQSARLTRQFNNLELGHYHGIPKPHKVNSFPFISILD